MSDNEKLFEGLPQPLEPGVYEVDTYSSDGTLKHQHSLYFDGTEVHQGADVWDQALEDES